MYVQSVRDKTETRTLASVCVQWWMIQQPQQHIHGPSASLRTARPVPVTVRSALEGEDRAEFWEDRGQSAEGMQSLTVVRVSGLDLCIVGLLQTVREEERTRRIGRCLELRGRDPEARIVN